MRFFAYLPLILSFQIFTPIAFSDITNFDVTSGYSVKDLASSNGTTNYVYGGFAGASPCGDTEVCNSCSADASPTTDCNERQVGDDVRLYFSFTVSKTGTLLVTLADGTTTIGGSHGSVSAGDTASLYVTWAEMCEADDSSLNGCEEDPDVRHNFGIRVGVSSSGSTLSSTDDEYVSVNIRGHVPRVEGADCNQDYKGICDIEFFPGDSKVRISSISSLNEDESDFVIDSNLDIEKVRIFYSFDSFSDALFNEDNYEDIAIQNQESIGIQFLSGFDNDVPVALTFANVDTAGNVYLAKQVADIITDTACNNVDLAGLSSATADDIRDCPYTATPQEVFGLLGDSSCFIATATYGTNNNHQLKIFRAFRSKILNSHPAGKKLIRAYYKYGLIASKYVKDSPALKTTTRVLLYPMYLFSWLSLKVGLLLACLISLFLFLAPVFLFRRIRKGAIA